MVKDYRIGNSIQLKDSSLCNILCEEKSDTNVNAT